MIKGTMASQMQVFPKAKVNGRFHLREKIGQGSFGQVFKGTVKYIQNL